MKTTGRSFFPVALLLPLFFLACSRYHALALDSGALMRMLRPPSFETIRVQAKSIRHPLLRPIDFRIDDGLSPDEAAIVAILANPKLRAIRDERGIATAQLLQAGILPNPQVSYSFDVPTGGSTQGTINAYGLGLSWDVTSLLTRGPEVAAARAHAESVDLDVAWQEWQVAQGAKLHLLRLVSIRRELALAKGIELSRREELALVRRAFTLHDRTALDLAAAESAAREAHLSVLALARDEQNERQELNLAMGFPASSTPPIAKDLKLPSWPVLPAVDQITRGLEERRLDLVALRMGYDSQDANLRAAIRAQFPKINVGATRARDTTNVITTGYGVTIDLPLFDRNQGHIAIERATRRQLFDEYVSRDFESRAEIARILLDMDSVKRRIAASEDSLPKLEEVASAAGTALRSRDVDILVFGEARNNLTARKREILVLERDLAELGVALEIAAGRYFPDEPAPIRKAGG